MESERSPAAANVSGDAQNKMWFSSSAPTCPPLEVEKILMIPPHCFTYQRNQRADTSWGSEVTFTLTNRVPNWRALLGTRERGREVNFAGKTTNNKKKSGIWNVECGIIVENQTAKRSLQNTVLAKAGEDNIILWDSQHYITLFFYSLIQWLVLIKHFFFH